jgi:hypothetical protein
VVDPDDDTGALEGDGHPGGHQLIGREEHGSGPSRNDCVGFAGLAFSYPLSDFLPQQRQLRPLECRHGERHRRIDRWGHVYRANSATWGSKWPPWRRPRCATRTTTSPRPPVWARWPPRWSTTRPRRRRAGTLRGPAQPRPARRHRPGRPERPDPTGRRNLEARPGSGPTGPSCAVHASGLA